MDSKWSRMNLIKAKCIDPTSDYKGGDIHYGETYFIDINSLFKIEGFLYGTIYERSKTNKNLAKGTPLMVSAHLYRSRFDIDFNQYPYEPI